jgi:predicted  nucleic acid-binding Zn-ribbon protein
VTAEQEPGDPRQQTLKLVALGEVDRKRSDAQSLMDAVPRVLASRSRHSREAQAMLDACHLKLQGFRVHLKSLELDLGEREEALSKANGNLLSAKTNQEYSLMIGEITRKREETGVVEERILEQYDVIRQGEEMVETAESGLVAVQDEYGGFEERARGELAEHQKELVALDERRDQVRKAISEDILKIYDRVYNAHGVAIVPAEGNTCQGCFSTLTPNDRNRLLSGRQLVVCRACQRILYMPEALHASPS